MSPSDEAARLEALWAGEFGDAYVDRNRDAQAGRAPFWRELVARHGVTSALEVGCNVGGNLRWLAEAIGAQHVAGVDINEKALATARAAVPGADLRHGSARALPWPDRAFDLTLTVGVLIHQHPGELGAVMDEVVRCSSRLVLCAEYAAEDLEEVPYRGEEGALFKQDFGARYRERFPDLELVEETFLPRGEGTSWDDVTVWLFRRPA